MSTNSNRQELNKEYGVEPYLMTILSKKFDAITGDMTQSLLRSARSGVINVARDFSSGITLYDGRQFVIDEGVPVQLANIDLVPMYTMEKFDDIQPGDMFLTNSPYAGNVHHADYTFHSPVFYDGEPLFWAMSRAHQADIGANEPSTYLPEVENVYQEAMHLPSVRIQRDYEDCEDIVRMLQTNIRLGDTQWLGDYKAQVASVRAGEEGLQELCEEYGPETVKSFTEAWLNYGEQMMRREIRDLPNKSVEHTSYHDPIPGAEDGVPINVKMDIQPEKERIKVDLMENIDYLPNGFNLCEATTVAGVHTAIFNNLSSDLPHNEGSMSRVEIEMGEGKFVGKEQFPAATAVSTTHGFDILVNALQSAFADLGEPYGIAQGNPGFPPSYAVISGTDFRRDDEPYVNQIFHLGGGGPALHGHDGWETFVIPAGAGVTRRDSIEIDEQKYPILVHRNELRTDSEGAGEWRGSPGSVSEFSPRGNPMTVAYIGNGVKYPPEGVLGGTDGAPQAAKKRTVEEDIEELPPMGFAEIEPGESIIGHVAGGGGYGDPVDRDPASVCQDVEDGIVTQERAREVYGVVLKENRSGLTVDADETANRRAEMQGGEN
jgi:N-methylhydantoinase B